MAVTNGEIAAIFDQLADLLEVEGEENPFRIRAYRNAARVIRGLDRNLAQMVAKGEDLEALPRIGHELAAKIREIVQTGRLRTLERHKRAVPHGLAELLRVPGLGPKRIQRLREELGIENLRDLEKAAREGKLRQLPGFGAKTEQNILREIEALDRRTRRFLRAEVEEMAEALRDYLAEQAGVDEVVVAGSYRRWKETVGDLDILVTAAADSKVSDAFIAHEAVERVLSHGETRASVVLRHTGLQVDLRVVPAESFGAALHYFTGSRAHNIALRRMARDQGLKVNEYGLFQGEECLAGETEESLYGYFGMPWITPELREDRGELQAALAGKLPELITLDDLKGDLHCHTSATDGNASLDEMANAARTLGHQYLAITDHSHHLTVAHGQNAEAVARQIEAIDTWNAHHRGFRLLKGVEVDILDDGRLDLPDRILAQLDIVVAAIHSEFGLSRARQTERLLRAMDNPNVHVIAHPTGRLIGRRPAYDLDIDRVIAHAAEVGVALEVNSQPERLDLNDELARAAIEQGALLAISSDAHSTTQLGLLRHGVAQARRGWVGARHVINTRPWTELRKLLRGR